MLNDTHFGGYKQGKDRPIEIKLVAISGRRNFEKGTKFKRKRTVQPDIYKKNNDRRGKTEN